MYIFELWMNEWMNDWLWKRSSATYTLLVAFWCRRQKEWREMLIKEGCDRVLWCDTGILRVCRVNRMSCWRKSWKRSWLEGSGHTVDILRYDSVKREIENSVCERIGSVRLSLQKSSSHWVDEWKKCLEDPRNRERILKNVRQEFVIEKKDEEFNRYNIEGMECNRGRVRECAQRRKVSQFSSTEYYSEVKSDRQLGLYINPHSYKLI